MPSRSPDRGHERRLSDKEKSCQRNSYTRNLASEREKITHRPDFFTWMSAFDPGLGHIVGGPRRIDRYIRGPRTTPYLYFIR